MTQSSESLEAELTVARQRIAELEAGARTMAAWADEMNAEHKRLEEKLQKEYDEYSALMRLYLATKAELDAMREVHPHA